MAIVSINRKFMIRVSLLGALSLNFASCKTTTKTAGSSLASQTYGGRPRILLIGAGGWKSCGFGQNPYDQKIYDSFENLAKDVSQFADVDYMITCLGPTSPAVPIARFGISGSDKQVYNIRSKDLPDYVQRHINKTRPRQVYMIGHSYGGWVVLNLAEQEVPSTMIFTLDPIDARSCRPRDNIFVSLGVEDPACQRAPSMNYSKIGAATQRVYNLWQPLGPIHSTPINEDYVVNHEFDINHDSFQGLQTEKITYAHRMIGSDASAWGVICHKIFLANGQDKSGCRSIETDESGKKKGYISVDIPQMD